MKTRVYLSCTILALVASLSFFSYTRASVDDGITISSSPAQQATPLLHPTPVVSATPIIHVTPIAQPTPIHTGGSDPSSGSNLPLTGGNPSTSLSVIVILLGAVGVALLALSRAISKRA